MAIIETLPLLVIFVMLIAYGLGLFGAIHTAVLYSISARQYAFETFRHRTNLEYFRENQSGLTTRNYHLSEQIRFHGIQTDYLGHKDGSGLASTARRIRFDRKAASSEADIADHNTKIFNMQYRNRGRDGGGVEVSPIWIKVGYGLCLTAECGGE